MSAFVDFIKNHPVGASIGAASIVAAYLILHNSGSGTASGVSSADLNAESADVAYATQYQTAQLQANQAALESNNQAAVANNQVTGQEVVATLQSQDTLAGIAAQESVQTNSDTLSAQTTQAVSTLQAQVAENQTAASIQMAQINASAYVNIANAPYQSADYIAGLQEQVALASLPSNAAITSLQNEINTLYGDLPQPGQVIGIGYNNQYVYAGSSLSNVADLHANTYTAPVAPTPIAGSTA